MSFKFEIGDKVKIIQAPFVGEVGTITSKGGSNITGLNQYEIFISPTRTLFCREYTLELELIPSMSTFHQAQANHSGVKFKVGDRVRSTVTPTMTGVVTSDNKYPHYAGPAYDVLWTGTTIATGPFLNSELDFYIRNKFNVGDNVKYQAANCLSWTFGFVSALDMQPTIPRYEINHGSGCEWVDEDRVEYMQMVAPGPGTYIVQLPPISDPGRIDWERYQNIPTVPKPKCTHEMVDYTGMTERYKYCKKCDKKEGHL